MVTHLQSLYQYNDVIAWLNKPLFFSVILGYTGNFYQALMTVLEKYFIFKTISSTL